jgi:hypothetical protein
LPFTVNDDEMFFIIISSFSSLFVVVGVLLCRLCEFVARVSRPPGLSAAVIHLLTYLHQFLISKTRDSSVRFELAQIV